MKFNKIIILNIFQIQKIIFISLTFLSISTPPADALSLNLVKNLINKQKIRFSSQNKLIDSKIYKDKFLTNLENTNSNIIPKKKIDQNIKSPVNELLIESKIQSEKDNILYADGDVVVTFKDSILKADSLTYNKNIKLAKAEGNVQLKINDQIFQADMVQYDFVKRKGNFKNVKGLMNSESIISDFNFYSNSIHENLLSTIQSIKKNKVVFTPNQVSNWNFSTDLLKFDQDVWSSKKLLLTNDLLETNQIKLQFNELQVYPYKESLKFKSKINYLILEERVVIPFWLGERTIYKKKGKSLAFDFENRWNIGYDKLNNDGFFIGRKFDSIKFSNNLFLKIEPQFLFDRALRGKTNSFVQKNYSLNSQRVERNISLSDYFALNSSIEGKIKNWDLKITKELNSFDLEKFANSIRSRAELSKEINLFNTSFVQRIFGAYRERIWNGSIGESEIHNAYGLQLDQSKFWKDGAVEKSQIMTFGLGNYKAEELTSSDFTESFKGSISYQLEQTLPIYKKKIDSVYIDKSFEYIPEPIKQGVFIKSKIIANYNSYKDGNSQKYFGVGLGPEIVIGNFKRDFFDYTRLSVLPFYKFKSGKSIFKFDNLSENFTLDLNFDQQLIGSWLIEAGGKLNLDKHSDDYGEFIYSRIAMNFKKRSYSFGIFYQPHDQSGGINFTLNGFK